MANPWASAYPMRPAGAPASNVVQSGEEFKNEWGAKIADLRRSANQYGAEQDAQRIASEQLMGSFAGSTGWVDPDLAKRYAADPTTFSADPSQYTPDTYKALDAYRQSTFQTGGNGDNSWAPAALAQAEAQYSAAGQQRDSNNIRQQQAFDTTMMGNGAIGGVMPSDYSSPTYGQITGQKPGGLGGLGGVDLTGVDNAQQSGAYMGGSGAYNPSPWSSGSFTHQNPWTGF